MEIFSDIFNFVFQYLDNITFLILSASGLMIIFGMMGVINMAHGELMMVGAYIMVNAYHAGIPEPIALILAALGAGVVGVIMERLIIRHFYKQLLSSLVVTWGISLILSQGFLQVFGPSVLNVPTPFESFQVGEYSYAYFRVVMFIVAIAMVVGTWLLLTRTSFGIRAQATMEKPEMAESLGIDTSKVYALTFGFGSALAGLAGGVFAMTATISPFFGANYTPMAFITVVVGGAANVVTGLLSSVFALAGIQTVTNNLFNVYLGYVALIATALVILVFLPTGISDYLERRKLMVMTRGNDDVE